MAIDPPLAAVQPRGDRPLFAIALVLVAYLSFSFIDSSVKWLTLAGLPAIQLSFMRYLGHFVISFGITGFSKNGLPLRKTNRFGLVLLRAALLAGSTVLNFIALKTVPLTLTSTILFMAPIIVCLLSWPLLGEKVGPYRGSAVVIGFVGVLVAIRPFSEEFEWAALLSIASASCFAFYTILTRILAGQVRTDVMQFYSGFVGAAVLLPFAILEWQSPTNGLDWTIMIMIGFFGWMGHELLTRAYGYTEASNLVPFAYSFIIYLGLWSIFVFDHIPTIWTITGAAIITVAGLIIWVREMQRARVRARQRD